MRKNERNLDDFFKKTEYLGNFHIPSLIEVNDLFAGELGWYEGDNREKPQYLEILRGERKVKLTRRERKSHNMEIVLEGLGEDVMRLVQKQKPVPAPKYKTESVYQKLPIQRLARRFSSIDYALLGEEDNRVGVYVPSKRFVKTFNLRMGVDSFNMRDHKGRLASISVYRGDEYGTHENLLYLRKDLLERFLKKCEKKLFILAWGERDYWPEDTLERGKNLSSIYQKRQNIYREMIRYK